MPPKFSKNNSLSPAVDFADVDAAGNRLASPADVLNNNQNDFDAIFNRANGWNGLTYAVLDADWNDPDWEKLAATISGRACLTRTEFDNSLHPSLVKAQPHKGLPILAEIQSGMIRGRFVRDQEMESVIFDVVYFQRIADGLGDQLEVRIILGSKHVSAEEFFSEAKIEIPHPVAQSSADKLVRSERAKRLNFEKRVAALPPEVSQADQMAEGIARGIATALVQLGFTKPAKP